MEDLILKCNTEDGTVLVVLSTPKKEGNLEFLTQDKDGCTILEITPSQTRELIEHLTNCLKEVENG